MAKRKPICVFDFETDDSNPYTCEPTELAALMLDPMTLEVMKDSEFSIEMRPPDIDEESYFEDHFDCINWHAKNYEVSPQEILATWKKAPSQKSGWESFVQYLLKYNANQSRKTKFTAPIAGGTNIGRFDLNIIDRLSKKYGNCDKNGESKLFNPRDTVDIMHLAYFWFENDPSVTSYSMDFLRNYLGMNTSGIQHNAMQDVYDEATIIVKFMRLHRNIAPKVGFKGSCGSSIREGK